MSNGYAFPNLQRLFPGEDPANKLNIWASHIQNFANNISFLNFNTVLISRNTQLYTPTSININFTNNKLPQFKFKLPPDCIYKFVALISPISN